MIQRDVPTDTSFVAPGWPDLQDHRSYAAFYEDEFPRMVSLAFALSGSRLAAEDLAQEAMLAAHRAWDRVGIMDRPGAWTRRVVINKAASLYQRRRAEFKALVRLAPLRGAPPAPLDAETESVWAEVRRLPKRQAQAVALFYLDDLPVREIALTMDCTESTVRVHLFQARKALAERLRIEGEVQ